MRTLNFVSNDSVVTVLIGAVLVQSPAPIICFVSALRQLGERTCRAGHDADAQKAERFMVPA